MSDFKLYPFQEEGVATIQAKDGRCLVGDQMGLGKTVQVLTYIARNPHIRPIVIVCPASVKGTWEHEAKLHLGMRVDVLYGTKASFDRVKGCKIVVVNYDILYAWIKHLKRLKPELVVADECFPYDTPVLTDQGEIPIGRIVEEKLPVKVASWDFSNNGVDYRPIHHYLKITRRTRIVTVHHSEGQLVCTEEHEVWTENRGYVKAIDLAADDQLRVVRKENKDMQQRTKTVLRHGMCGEMEMQQTGDSGENVHARIGGEDRGVEAGETTPGFRDTHDEEQPRQQTGGNRENQDDQGEERDATRLVRHARGERATNDPTKNALGITRVDLESGTADSDGEETRVGVSQQLQSGHRKGKTQDRGGDRRATTSGGESESCGRKETTPTRIVRVDRVEIHESADRLGSGKGSESHTFVYCLNVERNHNFFASGVLVHNCHYLMSPGTRRTKAVKSLIDGVKRFIPVSGTAITSRPIQLFPVLQMLWPKKFRSRHKFGTEFCRARFRFGQWDYRGASNLKRLHRRLTRLGMVRRLKKDVLKDLPERRRMVVPISLPPEAMKEYHAAAGDTARWLRSNYGRKADSATRAEALVKVGYLKRLAAKLKLDMMVEWVENFLQETDEKIILFCVHKAVVRRLQEKFKGKCAVVTGEVTGTKRQQQFNSFNTDKKCRVFIGNIQAAGVGWSAKKCSTVAFLEMSWNPGDHSQAADRIHGIGRGQKGIQSDTYWLIATGTIETNLLSALEKKQRNVDAVLDGRVVEELDLHDSLMKELMKGEAA